jgi:predicted DNA-binding transcriptional regulator AlpA
MRPVASPRSGGIPGNLRTGSMQLADAPEATAALEPLLTAAEVAQVLGVRPKRVYELGIPSVRLSTKSLRWRRSAVQAWIDSRSEGTTR